MLHVFDTLPKWLSLANDDEREKWANDFNKMTDEDKEIALRCGGETYRNGLIDGTANAALCGIGGIIAYVVIMAIRLHGNSDKR